MQMQKVPQASSDAKYDVLLMLYCCCRSIRTHKSFLELLSAKQVEGE